MDFTYLNKNFSNIYLTTLSQAQICLQMSKARLTLFRLNTSRLKTTYRKDNIVLNEFIVEQPRSTLVSKTIAE